LAALLLASLMPPLRQRLVRAADQVMYGVWYDYQSAVQAFSNKLSKALQSEQLVEILTGELPALLQAEGAILLWSRRERVIIAGVGRDVQSWQLDTTEQIPFTPIQDYLLTHGTPTLFHTLSQVLGPRFSSRPVVTGRAAEDTLWVPLVYSGYLMGILILGPKRGNNHFSWKDLQILETLSYQAAVVSQQVQLIDSLRQHGLEMNQLYQAVVKAREAERKHLARELHDAVIQDLISLKHRLESAGPAIDESTSAGRLAQEQIAQLIDTLRQLCAGLRPPVLDSLGLAPALRYHMRQFEGETGLSTQFSIEGDEMKELPEDVELCLFRVLQEALHNVQHHAQAKKVTVCLTLRQTAVVLVVGDDGQGFAVPDCLGHLVANGHFGLAGVRERVEAANGHISIRSARDSGTQLKIWLPLPPARTLTT
jgi:signal transduction histidine kinase